jgi:hypothetical protein
MQTLELRLRFIHQSTGALEHVVIYNASVELNDRSGQIEIIEVGFFDAEIPDADMVQKTLEAIKTGMQNVLEPRGLGARVRINGLMVHPIDWQPKYFEQYTRETLEQTLQDHKL